MEVFLRHVTLVAIVHDWPQSNAEKRGPVKDTFPSFRWGAARRSLQCSPCYDKQYSWSFFNTRRGAAYGSTGRRAAREKKVNCAARREMKAGKS